LTIGLVLDTPGQLAGALGGHGLAVHVEALGDNAVGTTDRIGQAREREAALVVLLPLLRQVERGVNEVAEHVVHVVREHSQPHANLRGGQAEPRGIHHRVGEILDQPAQFGIEVGHRVGGRSQNWVAEQAYRLDAH
jgi:hypothetical protein